MILASGSMFLETAKANPSNALLFFEKRYRVAKKNGRRIVGLRVISGYLQLMVELPDPA